MSVFAASAPQIWAMETGARESQFHAGPATAVVALCPGASLPRNDVTLSQPWFRVIIPPRGDQSVPERYWLMRAILAILFLCTAFACGQARAQPSAETIA